MITSNVDYENSDETKVFNFSIGLAMGKEKRRLIAENLKFIHGWEPNFHLRWNNTENPGTIRSILGIQVALGYIMGFQYDVSNRFYLSLETIPQIEAGFELGSRSKKIINGYTLSTGFSSQYITISMVYSFVVAKS